MRKKELRKLAKATLGELRGKTRPQKIDYLRKCVVDKESYARRAAIEGVKLEVAREVVRELRAGAMSVNHEELVIRRAIYDILDAIVKTKFDSVAKAGMAALLKLAEDNRSAVIAALKELQANTDASDYARNLASEIIVMLEEPAEEEPREVEE